eukprot:2666827-Pleurochrysis_carterae.AAC.1
MRRQGAYAALGPPPRARSPTGEGRPPRARRWPPGWRPLRPLLASRLQVPLPSSACERARRSWPA